MSDFEPNAEQNTGLPIENFLQSAKELERLREGVTEAGGNVRILVHPFFAKQDLTSPRYGEPLQRLLDSTSPDMPPIMVLEAQTKLAATQQFIEANSSSEVKRKLFFVPTLAVNDPEPYTLNSEGRGTENNWKLFKGKLKEAGVKKALVGGTNLEIASYLGERDFSNTKRLNMHAMSYKEKIDFLHECVGIVVKRLKDDFQVEVSNIAAPKRRVDMIKN